MSSHRFGWLVLVLVTLAGLWARPSGAAPAEASKVPAELAEWIEWVEHDEPEPRDCRVVDGDVLICVWPSYLSLEVGPTGAKFALDVTVFGPSVVELPGDEQQWPQQVELDGKTRAVLLEGQGPMVELDEGRHTLTGFIPWRVPPDSLRVPAEIGLVDLVVGGTAVPFPTRSGVTLSLVGAALGDEPLEPDEETEPDEEAEPVPDSETIEVSRRLTDGVPLQVTTRIDVHVAGKARELILPDPTLEGVELLQVTAPVPVTIGEDGSLVLQVRRGTLAIELLGVLPRSPERLGPPQHPAPWPDDEVWVWNAAPAGAPSMGQVSLSGARAVDLARTHAPSQWQGGAAYRLEPDGALRFEVIQRGVSETSTNQLELRREMRVDLAGTGWTIVDDISGEMNRGNRMDLRHEQGVLGSVATNGQPQVITVTDDGHAGVEVRGPALDMRAQWRIEGPTSTLPLGGWSEDFDAVDLSFMLPRGWDLLYADGPGSLGPTWWGAWRPLDLISLLGVVLLVGRIIGPAAGLAALVGLGLGYTRNGDGYLLLLALVATATGLVLLLRRPHARGVEIALRVVWAAAAFMIGAWVVWRVPAGVAAVWRDGLSGLAHVRLEHELQDVATVAMVLAGIVAGVLGLAVAGARRATGLERAVLWSLMGVLGVGLVLVMLFETTLYDASAPGGGDDPTSVDFAEVGAQQEELARAPEPPAEPASAQPSSRRKSGLAFQDREDAKSNDDDDVWGGLTGSEVGEAYGVGGLGLVGTGRGGGGTGEGPIGLGNTGLIGKGGGEDGPDYGRGDEAGYGGRGSGSPPPPPGERFVAKDVDLPPIEAPAVPQTGDGVPEWTGPRWTMSIDRTVKRDESVTLWLVTPTVSRVISVVRALALVVLGFLLLREGLRGGWWSRPRAPSEPSSPSSGGAHGIALGVGLVLLAMAPPASAAPPPELLEELSARVNADRPLAPSPECGASCALVNELEVTMKGDTLTLRAEVHMAGPGVWALPGSIGTWLPRTVTVDGTAARAMVVYDDQLLLHLGAGLHEVELSGAVRADVLDLDLAGAPKHVVVDAEGWVVDGVDDDDRAESLHLVREWQDAPGVEAAPEDPEAALEGSEAGARSRDMEPWFAVQRRLQIGPRWTMETTVTRLSHGPSPTKVHVPLLAGEKMLEASGKIDEPKATVTLRTPGESITWSSVLEPSPTMELVAPTGEDWTETWIISCAGAWQCEDEGTPATTDSGGTRVFHPWPGETLRLSLLEPSPAEGQLLAIDHAAVHLHVGETGTEARLTMRVRTATVTERTLTLPAEAHLGSVRIDGSDVPMAKDAVELRLTFQPGLHDVEVEFQLDAAAAAVVHAPVVGLGGQAVNARVTFEFSDAHDRVVVWTSGEGRGPMVWLWPYIGVLALLALGMARYATPRMSALRWFLLGLGFSVLALPLVWLWFVLVGLRERHASRLDPPVRYNAAQIALGVATLVVVAIVGLTAKELLTSPTSTLVHDGAEGSALSWYLDRTEASTPAAMVVTAPLGLWRALWAVWVVWLAYRSIAWGKWAWGVAAEDGWLHRRPGPPPNESSVPTRVRPAGRARPEPGPAAEASSPPEASASERDPAADSTLERVPPEPTDP